MNTGKPLCSDNGADNPRSIAANGPLRGLKGELTEGGQRLPCVACWPTRISAGQKEQCENLLVPVCLSATHVAYGSIRMEPVYMSLGHASGLAAMVAIRTGRPVQEIDVKALQTKLLAAKQVLSLPPQAKASKAP